MLRKVQPSDVNDILEIYNYYIENSTFTFENKTLTPEDLENKIEAINNKNYPYIVYEVAGKVIGFAYLNTFRWHAAYNITAETSIYVSPEHKQKGIGLILYEELIKRAKENSLHSLIAVLSLPNEASRCIHHKLGFKSTGIIKEAGFKFDKLIDIEFWQLIL